jgi:DNA-binding transcriptional LysR family regulator
VVRVLPRHAVRAGGLHVLWPSARHVPLRVALFRDFLIEELGRLQMQHHELRKKSRAKQGASR